jgi:hypothetical protein
MGEKPIKSLIPVQRKFRSCGLFDVESSSSLSAYLPTRAAYVVHPCKGMASNPSWTVLVTSKLLRHSGYSKWMTTQRRRRRRIIWVRSRGWGRGWCGYTTIVCIEFRGHNDDQQWCYGTPQSWFRSSRDWIFDAPPRHLPTMRQRRQLPLVHTTITYYFWFSISWQEWYWQYITSRICPSCIPSGG